MTLPANMTLANHGPPSAHRVCPSLYAAIRLARLVLRVKERLKSRMKSRRLRAGPSVISRRDSRNARVIQEAKLAIKTRARKPVFTLPGSEPKQIRDEKVYLPTLLHELHANTLPSGASLLKAAEDDDLFLQQDAQKIAQVNNRVGLCDLYDVTTLLLNRLQHFSDDNWPAHGNHHEDGQTSWAGFTCPKTMANLEHLLRCLQQASYFALINDLLRGIEADLACWYQYWQQSRAFFHGWFSEWPNSRRPLNTTWPWNVKPSLVVLWGVCWMFYGDGDRTGRTRKPPQRSQPQHYAPVEPQPQLVANRTPTGSYLEPLPFDHFNFAPNATQSSELLLNALAGLENPLSWSVDLNSNILSNTGFAPLQTPINTPNPQNPDTLLGAAGPQGRPGLHGQPTGLSNTERTICQTGTGLTVPSFNMRLAAYPSPNSPVSTLGVSPLPSNQSDTPAGLERATSTIGESPSSAPDNSMGESTEKGVFRCVHPACANEPPEFTRRCEYTKHRDKHDRPHICREPSCEKIRGFTYAGGLHRHQREVHRQHGGPKGCYKCPHPNCKRSGGDGFSRKENLTEHLRRVHRKVGEELATSSTTAGPFAVPGADFANSALLLRDVKNTRKRRRAGDDSEGESEESGLARELQNQINEMKKHQQDTDERVKTLENQIQKLSAALRTAAAAT